MPIKSIVTNMTKLALVSSPVVDFVETLPIIDDLLDTAKKASQEGVGCVGLACNQIGILKRIIVVFVHGKWVVMINPVIEPNVKAGRTSAKEMCLSRPGVKTFRKRYKKITVAYTDENLAEQSIIMSRMNARIIQHEVDHLDGITI